MASSDVKIDVSDVLKRLERQKKAMRNTKKALDKAASYQETQILLRTARGVDADGKKFPPYDEGYKKTRQKKRRPVNRVNLKMTGKMLASMTHKTTPKEATIYFASGEESKKAYFNNKKRNFFGISKKDITGIKNIIKKEIIDG